MSNYTPDKWLMVKLTNNVNESHYRIFACWYGGYTGSDSWKLNSGVTKITEEGRMYYFEGSSGSVYICDKRTYGTSGYGAGVLNTLIKKTNKIKLIEIEILPGETNFMELNYE